MNIKTKKVRDLTLNDAVLDIQSAEQIINLISSCLSDMTVEIDSADKETLSQILSMIILRLGGNITTSLKIQITVSDSDIALGKNVIEVIGSSISKNNSTPSLIW